MAGKLLTEIQQTRPFALIEEEAILNVARTAEVAAQHMANFLKPYALTGTQYNVLRILRGAGKDGITCSQLSERMISRDPDISRLLDRMEARSLVIRERSKEDRRIVLTRISENGLDLVNSLDKPVRDFLKATIGKIKKHRLEELVEGLEKVREVFG